MAQSFIDDFTTSDTFGAHPDRLDTNFSALRSSFSGASFPSAPTPVNGQLCWRTDRGLDVAGGGKTGRLYRYTGNTAVGENGWVVEEETSPLATEISNARGTKLTLDQRLDIALNEDGTLKSSVTAYQSEWILPSLTFTYVSATSFTTNGNTTDIYLFSRRLKINLLSSVAFSEVVSSSYDSGSDTTTINILDAVLDNTLLTTQHAIVSPYQGSAGGSLKVYNQSEIDTKAKLWQNKPVTKNLTADTDYTLTATENLYGRIIITDTTPFLTMARNIIVDASERLFIFQNDTLQTLTVKTSAGIGISILPTESIALICDGTNVIEANELVQLKLKNSGFTTTLQSGTLSGDVVHTLPTRTGSLALAGIARPTKTGVTTIVVDGNSLEMSLYVTPTAGLDYYFSKTAITTTVQADTIGGFHYSLVPHAEAPTGNKTEADMVKLRGINEYSIWTLWYRPICFDPRGKAKVGSRWYDIYPMDRDYGIRGYSAPTVHTGANIAAGVADATYFRQIPKIPLAYGGDGTVTYGKYTWFQACEVATATGNQNISYNEFPTIAYGVLEGVDSSAYGDNGTIFHIPQLMSKYGIEMATGTEYVWGADVFSDTSGTYIWQSVTDSRGQVYSVGFNPKAVILGGGRTNGVHAGSRASAWYFYVWDSHWSIGSRFACDSLEHA